jgi:hypothetical protein
MGIDGGSTLRWTKARERNRLKARYLIRSSVISRVVDNIVDVDNGDGGATCRRRHSAAAVDGVDDDDSATLPSSSSPSSSPLSATISLMAKANNSYTTNEVLILRHYLERIIQNDVSSFSVAALAKHGHILEKLPLIMLLPTPTIITDDDASATATSEDTDIVMTNTTSTIDSPSIVTSTSTNTCTTTSSSSIQHHSLITTMMSTTLPWEMDDLQQRKHEPYPPQPTTLATSKYGRQYVTYRIVPYMQRITCSTQQLRSRSSSSSSSSRIKRRSLTIFEYASLLGRHDIVSMLLLGGLDPTFLPMETGGTSDGEEDCNDVMALSSSNDEASRSVLALLHNVPMGETNNGKGHEDGDDGGEGVHGGVDEECCSSRIPLSIWAYIVRAVIDMRMNGILDDDSYRKGDPNTTTRNTNGEEDDATISYYCTLCSNNDNNNNHPHRRGNTTLMFGPPCYHSFCEPCMWKHLVKHVPNCTNLKRNVVTCPICEEEFRGLNSIGICRDNSKHGKVCEVPEEKKGDGDNSLDMKELSLRGDDEQALTVSSPIGDSTKSCRRLQQQLRCNESLSKFMKLPTTCAELKLSKKKKKRRDYIHGTWEEALHTKMSTMQSQSVRSDRFFKAVLTLPQLVSAYLGAGVDVNMQNEYGQTPLYLACWKGSISVVRTLLDYGANMDIAANGGSTCYSIAKKCRRMEVLQLLEKNATIIPDSTTVPTKSHANVEPPKYLVNRICQVSILIDPTEDHPGAGACIVDNALSDEELQRLEDLWKSLPVASDASSEEDMNEKNTVTYASISYSQANGGTAEGIGEGKSAYRPSRYYFCDAEEWVQTMLADCVVAARNALLATKETQQSGSSKNADCISTVSRRRPSPPTSIFQHIRFLNYERPGGILPPHVDLCRVDGASGYRSTHTFILYLTDCGEGDGTALLQQLKDPKVLSVVQPERGRVLLFPHMCPHSGLEVVRAPKLLLRGEIILDISTTTLTDI